MLRALFDAAAAGRTVLAHTNELAAALSDAVERLHVAAGHDVWPTPRIRDFAELAAMAEWARDGLRADPDFRAWLCIPDLDLRRADVQDAFDVVLAPQRFSLSPQEMSAPYAVAGGTPLDGYAPVRAALNCLAATAGPVTAQAFIELLRMPELQSTPADAAAAARLDVDVRARGRWMLKRGYRDDVREHALSARCQGRVVRVVFDRSFVDEQGIRWVIDYKTCHHGGGNLEEFLAHEVERYAPQLPRYAQVTRRLGPEPVRVGLYFPLLGAWREWEPDA